MRVLFIGNSHTYFNDMPALFAAFCRQSGVDMEVTMLTATPASPWNGTGRSILRPVSTSSTATMTSASSSSMLIPSRIRR